MIIEEEVYLEHYGVKGMRWGVRKDRKSSEQDIKTKKGSNVVRSFMKTKKADTKLGSSSPYTPLIIYGAALSAVILTQAVKLRADSGRKDAKQTGDKEFNKDPNLKKNMSVSELHKKVVKPINPDYPGAGTKMNCRRATMAYEMRRRGYDVKATKSLYASGQTTKGIRKANSLGKDRKFQSIWGETRVSTVKEFASSSPEKKASLIFSSLSSQPNNSRGELGLAWTMGGGHSMAWEIVNNRPVIFDTQNSKVYKTPKEFSSFTPTVYEVAHTRLDNTKIDEDFIKRWVINA